MWIPFHSRVLLKYSSFILVINQKKSCRKDLPDPDVLSVFMFILEFVLRLTWEFCFRSCTKQNFLHVEPHLGSSLPRSWIIDSLVWCFRPECILDKNLPLGWLLLFFQGFPVCAISTESMVHLSLLTGTKIDDPSIVLVFVSQPWHNPDRLEPYLPFSQLNSPTTVFWNNLHQIRDCGVSIA